MDQQHRRDSCDTQGNRNALAQALMDNTHLQGERGINPPLRDKYNRYSVTGMAAATLTPATVGIGRGTVAVLPPGVVLRPGDDTPTRNQAVPAGMESGQGETE